MYKIRMISRSERLTLLGTIMALILPVMATRAISPASASTTQSAIVMGTKIIHFEPRPNYTFETNTELIFEAPEIDGWTFSYMKVDLGCRVGGVVGTNVTSVFSIEGGYIIECVRG